jgi:hypothetical protein
MRAQRLAKLPALVGEVGAALAALEQASLTTAAIRRERSAVGLASREMGTLLRKGGPEALARRVTSGDDWNA